MDRVPGNDDGEGRQDKDRRKNPEEQSIGLHCPPLVKSPRPDPSPFPGEGLRRGAAFPVAPVAARTSRPAGQNASPTTSVFRRAMSASFPAKEEGCYRYGASSAMLRANSRS